MTAITRRRYLADSAYCLAGLTGLAGAAGCGGGGTTVKLPVGVTSPNVTPVQLQTMEDAVSAFMNANLAPGVSVAISQNDSMVYSRGFGDANLSTGESVTPASRFRIASVTKPITAVAITMLVNAGEMKLTDPVFGPNGWLKNTYGPYATGQYDVTGILVSHLLTHGAGGWTNVPIFFDPTQLGLSQSAIIAQTLQTMPLTNPPGKFFGYSNFGYVLLGRVIEAVTKKSYSDAVKELVLQKCGISDMQIAGNTLADRLPNEVVYYDPNNKAYGPYNYGISRLDSAGGWVATATDLVNFLMRVDGIAAVPDVIPASGAQVTITTMTTLAPLMNNDQNYALGWGVNSAVPATEWHHTGAESGNSSELYRRSDGYGWAILVNTHNNGNITNVQLEDLAGKLITAMA